MSRVQIIGAPFSSYVRVVRMALEEKQVPYDLVPARMHSPEVLAIHPFGKIPVMRHGDLLQNFQQGGILSVEDDRHRRALVLPGRAFWGEEIEKKDEISPPN